MSYSLGKNFIITIFGQSHSEEIGVVVDGIPAGYNIDHELISKNLIRRRPGKNPYSTPRQEKDLYKIVSGEVGNVACGSPLCAIIENKDQRSKDYSEFKFKPRPSHADYPAHIKYKGHNDIRGGGQFSGRMTAPIVIAGSIAQDLLQKQNIKIFSRIKSISDVDDIEIDYAQINFDDWKMLKYLDFPVLDNSAKEKMQDKILETKEAGDSLGGIVELIVSGMPIGIGEPLFDSLESNLAKAIFSIPGVKGVEFGSGFNSTRMLGSQHNDSYYYDGNQVKTKTNNHGGIIGGLSTSMPIVIRVAIKPTSSIALSQTTVNLKTNTNETIEIEGRHDPVIVPRALVALEMITAIAILDMVMEGDK